MSGKTLVYLAVPYSHPVEVETMTAATLYVLAVLVANYTAAWFVPLPVFGMVSLAVFVFGVTFTLRDYAHQRGRRFVYGMIAAAAVANVLACLLLGVSWRIVLASFAAIILAESADTETYHRLPVPWLRRVAMSNAVSIPLDSLLFNGLAFAGAFDNGTLLAIIFGEIVIKTLMGFLVAVPRVRWACQS